MIFFANFFICFHFSLRVVPLCLIMTKCKRNLCIVPLLPYRRSPDFGQVLQLKLPEKLERENKEGGVIGNGRNHGKSHAFHIYGNVALYVWTLVMVKVMMVIPNFTVCVWTNVVWGGNSKFPNFQILPSVFEQMWFGGEQLWLPSLHSSTSRHPKRTISDKKSVFLSLSDNNILYVWFTKVFRYSLWIISITIITLV